MNQGPTPPPPHQYNHPSPKKGLGTGAMVGIGCGVFILLAIIVGVIATMMLGSKLTGYVDQVAKNPTRAAATMTVTLNGGKMKMIAEDDAKKRYTIKDEATGVLMTMYWDEQTQTPKTVTGDFSATPVAGATPPAEIEPTTDNATEEP